MKYLIIFILRVYQLCISPFLGQVCRFHPTCSCYAIEALQKHGCFKGSWLMIKRLIKCFPWHSGGIDPVP